jgi:uncharacterized protein involved in outer membrane biogenesis
MARRHVRALLLIGAAVLALPLLLIALLSLFPGLARGPSAQLASQVLHRPVELRALSFDPWSLSVRLTGIRIGAAGPGQPTDALAAIDEIQLQLAWASLLEGYPDVVRLQLTGPHLHLGRDASGQLDIQDLLDLFLKAPAQGPPAALVLQQVLVRDGRIEWHDARSGRSHVLGGLQFELPRFSTRRQDSALPVEPRLYGQLDGHLIVLYGTARLSKGDEALSVHFEVEDLRIPDFADVLPLPHNFALRDGRFDARMDARVQLRPGALPGVQLQGRLSLRDVDLRAAAQAATPLLRLASLDVPVTAFDLDQRSLHLGQVVVRGFAVHVRRDAQGRIDWVAQLLDSERSPPSPGTPAAKSDLGHLALDGLDFRDGSADWQDDAEGSPVRFGVRAAELTLGPLQWPATQPIGFAITLHGDHGEHAWLAGVGQPGRREIDAQASLAQIDIDRFSPYFAGRLPVRIAASPFGSSARLRAGLDDAGAWARISELAFTLPHVLVSRLSDGQRLVEAHGIRLHGLSLDTRAGAGAVDELDWLDLQSRYQAASGAAHFSQVNADWHAGHYQLGSLQVAQLALPAGLRASVLTGTGLDLDLPGRRYQLGSVAAAQLSSASGLRADALQAAEATADLGVGHYHAGLFNAAGLGAPGDNRVAGISLRDADLDLTRSRVVVAAGTMTGISLGRRFEIAQVEAAGALIDTAGRTAVLERLQIGDSRLQIVRTADGNFDLGTLMAIRTAIPAMDSERTANPGMAPQPANAASGSRASRRDGPRWQGELRDLQISHGAGSYQDHQRPGAPRLQWSELELHLGRLGTLSAQPTAFDGAVRINQDTRLSLRGQLAGEPLAGQLQLGVHHLLLPEWVPWLPSQLPLQVVAGTLDLDGTLRAQGHLAAPVFGWDGKLTLADAELHENREGARLLSWNSLQAQGVHVNTQPRDAAIEAIALTGLRAQLQLLADGSFNVSHLLDAGHGAAPAAATQTRAPPGSPLAGPAGAAPAAPIAAAGTGAHPATPFPLAIGRIEIRDGTVLFSDHFVRPEYSAQLDQLQGTITGLSSHATQPGQLELAGRLDGGASVRLSGALNPLVSPLALDLKAVVHGFELGPLSSYSTRFTGYPIVRGKLSFDVGYRLQDGVITASNQLTLDQLTLGPRQEVRGIRQLPIDLAVSLLKDSDGVIQVDLPIRGTLQDPQFNLGSIIAQLVTRAVERAVTAPFRWLGSLFGGEHAESFGWLAFAPGSDLLDDTARDKLARLAQALRAKPALRLDIAARGDARLDAQGVREEIFRQKLLVQKIRLLITAGQAIGDRPEAIQWTPAETPALLAAAWRQEHPGQTPPADTRVLEDQLRASIDSGQDILTDLGVRRSRAAQDWLTGSGGIDPARVFVLGQDDAAPPGADDGVPRPAARIDFSLR